jgi:hypothetical protein
MRPVYVTVTGIDVSAPIVVDQYISPANIGMSVQITGTATYVVQHTFDDPFSPTFTPGTAKWFNHPTLSGSADADGNYASPPRAVRLSVSASTGSVRLALIQAGRPGGE